MGVGGLIRDARRNRHWSQKELGRRLRVEGPTISRWETGHSPVPREQVNNISVVLGIPTATLEEAMGVILGPTPEAELYVPLVEFLSRRSLGEQKNLYDFLAAATKGPDQL